MSSGQSDDQNPTTPMEDPMPDNQNSWLKYGLAGLILVALIGGGIYYANQSGDEPAADGPKASDPTPVVGVSCDTDKLGVRELEDGDGWSVFVKNESWVLRGNDIQCHDDKYLTFTDADGSVRPVAEDCLVVKHKPGRNNVARMKATDSCPAVECWQVNGPGHDKFTCAVSEAVADASGETRVDLEVVHRTQQTTLREVRSLKARVDGYHPDPAPAADPQVIRVEQPTPPAPDDDAS